MKQKIDKEIDFDFSNGFGKVFNQLLKCPDCRSEGEWKCIEACDVYRLLKEIKDIKEENQSLKKANKHLKECWKERTAEWKEREDELKEALDKTQQNFTDIREMYGNAYLDIDKLKQQLTDFKKDIKIKDNVINDDTDQLLKEQFEFKDYKAKVEKIIDKVWKKWRKAYAKSNNIYWSWDELLKQELGLGK